LAQYATYKEAKVAIDERYKMPKKNKKDVVSERSEKSK